MENPAAAVTRESEASQPAEPTRAAHVVAVGFVVAALFLSHVVGAAYAGIGRPAPKAWALLTPFSINLSIVGWFWSYSRQQRIAWVLDMGWFVMAAWLVVIPYYLVKHEGRRGLARIGLFLLTYLAAWATGLAVQIWVRLLAS